jgi:hypothetical protein
MPLRHVAGRATLWEVALAASLTLASTAMLLTMASQIYSGTVLQTSKLSLRQGWKSRS